MKSEVLLFFFIDGLRSDTFPNVALMSLAAYVKKNEGINVKIICLDDYADPEHIIKTYMHDRVILCGISVLTPYITKAIKLSSVIKAKRKAAPIVWGGVHATLFPEQCFDCGDVDFAVRGDGEIPMLKLIQFLRGKNETGLDGIPGLYYRRGKPGVIVKSKRNNELFSSSGELDYDSVENIEDFIVGVGAGLYLPSYSNYGFFKSMVYSLPFAKRLFTFSGGRILPVLTGRGCPMKCTFCINNAYFRKPVKYDTDGLLDTMLDLKTKYGIDYFRFVDELFLVNRKFAVDFAERILQRNMDIKWWASGHANLFSNMHVDDVELLKKAGLVLTGFGLESGSERIIKRLKKGTNREKILKSAEILSKCNLPFTISFFCGIPGDRLDDYLQTLDIMRKIRELEISNTCWMQRVQFYRPYPGNELYKEALREGYIPPKKLTDWQRSLAHQMPGKTDNMPWVTAGKAAEITSYIKYARNNFLGYRHNPFLISMSQKLCHLYSLLTNKTYRKLDSGLKSI
ncbi:B12-binding domain-containing radical SAM protein [Fibrobacterota bacterium]